MAEIPSWSLNTSYITKYYPAAYLISAKTVTNPSITSHPHYILQRDNPEGTVSKEIDIVSI